MAPLSLTAVGAGFLVTFQSLGVFRESSSALGTVAGGLDSGQNFRELEQKEMD